MKKILETIDLIIKILKPPQAASWQTFILLSFGLWIISLFPLGVFQLFLAGTSWISLILGAGLFVRENPLTVFGIGIGSWIVGALACLFIFGSWNDRIPAIAFVFWPTISAIIAALPEFLQPGLKFSIPPPSVRQKLMSLLLSHLIISCWVQFHFLIQNWLQNYPSLIIDDFSKSAVVIKINTRSNPTSRGANILNSIEPILQKEINNKPWSEVERWLLTADDRIATISKKELEKSPKLEDSSWRFGSSVSSQAPGYNLQLIANWQGPSGNPGGYFHKKSCQILPTRRLAASISSTVASPGSLSQVRCGSATKPTPNILKSKKSKI